MSIEFWLFLPIYCFSFAEWLSFRATLRRFTRFNGFLPLCVPFGDPKGTEKAPATSDSARLAAALRRFLYNGTRPHQSFLAPLEGSFLTAGEEWLL